MIRQTFSNRRIATKLIYLVCSELLELSGSCSALNVRFSVSVLLGVGKAEGSVRPNAGSW